MAFVINSTAISATAGGGTHTYPCLTSDKALNQSLYSKKESPNPSGHYWLIHSLNSFERSNTDLFSGIKEINDFPFMTPSKVTPRDSPSIPQACILVPAMCITWSVICSRISKTRTTKSNRISKGWLNCPCSKHSQPLNFR